MNNRHAGVRGLLASPTFLTAVIALTAAAFFSLMSSFSSRASLLSSLSSLIGYSGSFRSLSLGSIIGQLPQIFVVVAFWLVYTSAAGQDSYPYGMNTTGLKMIDIYLLIMMILFCVMGGLTVLGLLAAMVGVDSLMGSFRLYSGDAIAVLVVGLLFAVAAYGFMIFLMMRARENCQSVIRAVTTGHAANDISLLIPVFCFIMGGLYGLDALRALAFGSISVISEGANATAAIAFGLFLNQYRRNAAGMGYAAPAYAPGYAPVRNQAPSGRATLYRKRTGENIPVNSARFVIGRNFGACSYVIQGNSGISGTHATIHCQNGRYYLVDNNSTNHVYLNGNRIPPNTMMPLSNRATFLLHNEAFVFIQE